MRPVDVPPEIPQPPSWIWGRGREWRGLRWKGDERRGRKEREEREKEREGKWNLGGCVIGIRGTDAPENYCSAFIIFMTSTDMFGENALLFFLARITFPIISVGIILANSSIGVIVQ